MTACHVCGDNKAISGYVGRTDTEWVKCPVCGDYEITRRLRLSLPAGDPARRKIERRLYETRGSGLRRLTLGPWAHNSNEAAMCLDYHDAQALYEHDGSALEKYERTIENISHSTRHFGQTFDTETDRWLIPTMSDEEALDIVHALMDEGILEGVRADSTEFRLTPDGLRRASEQRSQAVRKGNLVFVAACFVPDLAAARDALYEVVSDLGYAPRLIEREAHNNLIDLEIYEGIRQSRFVVADLTCNRQSVYYEVGFAHGLGLDAVLTCRSDSFQDEKDDFHRVHFDLNHRNILVWSDENDLAEKLRKHLWQNPGPYVRPEQTAGGAKLD